MQQPFGILALSCLLSACVGAITDDIVATQQGVADRFFKLGLIPKPVVVRDAVWKPAQT